MKKVVHDILAEKMASRHQGSVIIENLIDKGFNSNQLNKALPGVFSKPIYILDNFAGNNVDLLEHTPDVGLPWVYVNPDGKYFTCNDGEIHTPLNQGYLATFNTKPITGNYYVELGFQVSNEPSETPLEIGIWFNNAIDPTQLNTENLDGVRLDFTHTPDVSSHLGFNIFATNSQGGQDQGLLATGNHTLRVEVVSFMSRLTFNTFVDGQQTGITWDASYRPFIPTVFPVYAGFGSNLLGGFPIKFECGRL